MSTGLTISSWQANYEDLSLKWVWYPSLSLGATELAYFMRDVHEVNLAGAPLDYGFFDPKISDKERKAFLERTIWCLVYQDRKPIGLIYNYDLGVVDGQRLIHLGLVKLNKNIGKDMIKVPYIGVALGNLVNFGPYLATNVSHLPIIVDMFTWLCHDVYPAFETQDSAIRKQYLGALECLTKEYLVPVLGYDPKAVCSRSFTVRGSLAKPSAGFSTEWETIPKSTTFLCNLFVKEWLTMKPDANGRMQVQDDLIQIGKVDYRAMGESRIYPVLSQMQFEKLGFTRTLADLARIWPKKQKQKAS